MLRQARAAGDELDLDVTGVAHGGVFVGRHGAVDESGRGGRVIFVPDAIPGERVRIRLTDVGKKSFWRGEVIEVLDASPHRRPHIWRQADVTCRRTCARAARTSGTSSSRTSAPSSTRC